MAKRREGSGDEVSLFPFLSILACLIGALIMIIVVMCVAQTQKSDGRTPEEVQRAREYQELKKQLDEQTKLNDEATKRLAELKKLNEELEEKEQRYARLRKLLDSSKDVQEQNRMVSQQLAKELDDLMLEIDGLKAQIKESKAEIEKLMAEVKKRQVPPDQKPPPVIVQPGGSGMPEDTKVFFVEASGSALKIIKAWTDETYQLSSRPETVIADPKFNHFLTEVAKVPRSLIIFLIRDDGQAAFNNGAGRAQNDYKIRVAKLPIPGRGEIDLQAFAKYRGAVSPPPAETPPAAPAKQPS